MNEKGLRLSGEKNINCTVSLPIFTPGNLVVVPIETGLQLAVADGE